MRKNLLLIIVICIFSIGNSLAQTNQGNMLVGVSSTLSLAGTGPNIMSIGFSNSKTKSDADGFEEQDPDKSTNFNFLPKVGFFVADNLAIGLDLSYGYSSEVEGFNSDVYTRNLLSVGPFIRYYIPTEKVKPFIEVSGSYGKLASKYKSDNWEDYNSSRLTSFRAGVGMAISLSQRATFDILAGYNSLTVKSIEDNDDNYRGVINSFGLNFGFNIFLGKN